MYWERTDCHVALRAPRNDRYRRGVIPSAAKGAAARTQERERTAALRVIPSLRGIRSPCVPPDDPQSGSVIDIRDLFFVRLGYFHESQYKGNRQFLTLGAGLKYSIFEVDVSYMFTIDQHHPLENTLRFSLGFDVASFNKKDIKESMRLK